MSRLVRAELSKLLGLYSARGAVGASLAVAPVITFITASGAVRAARDGAAVDPDIGFRELAFGVMGAIILGVLAVSSEYLADGGEPGGSRQVTTSLTAAPVRIRFLLAKATAVALTVGASAFVASVLTLTITHLTLGDLAQPFGADAAARVVGVVIYWVLTALLAAGITLLTRSGIVPLTVLLLNTSLVSVTYLLSRVLPAANYLPDLAGARMFVNPSELTVHIAPLTGGLVMTGWVLAVLAVGAVVFHRRDA